MFTVMFSGGDTMNGGPVRKTQEQYSKPDQHPVGNIALKMHDGKCIFYETEIEKN